MGNMCVFPRVDVVCCSLSINYECGVMCYL